jgi:hypothetical protein
MNVALGHTSSREPVGHPTGITRCSGKAGKEIMLIEPDADNDGVGLPRISRCCSHGNDGRIASHICELRQ